MHLRLNPKSGAPIYEQIVSAIRHQVATGELLPGQQLPTVRDLAAQLGVNVNTVARAYDVLDKAGVISTQQGRGCYVSERPDAAELNAHRRDALRAIVDRALLEALSLGYEASEIAKAFGDQLKAWRHDRKRTHRKGT